MLSTHTHRDIKSTHEKPPAYPSSIAPNFMGDA